MITLEQGVQLVWYAFENMLGGEIYVKKIPSIKVIDIAKTIAPKAKHEIIGMRPGEKLHEQMISIDDASSTYEYPEYFKILPQINLGVKESLYIKNGIKVTEGFKYTSDNNPEWMTNSELQRWVDSNMDYIGKI
jgi:FlaA1/EpsC-like NDP-sugar epimerase